jgi:D-threo-aldose 1-dehydrogenase
MHITPAHHRPFGSTGLRVPPIMFRTCALASARRVITDQTKLAICGAWFQSVASPVLIELHPEEPNDAAVRAVGYAIQRLEIAPQEAIISLRLSGAGQRLTCESAIFALEDTGRSLGRKHRPQLISIDADAYLAAAESPADRDARLHEIRLTCRGLAEYKSAGELAGIGIVTRDWLLANEIERTVALDWLQLAGSLTLLHHPPELVDFLVELASRRVAVVVSSVFHGGFLLGGSRIDGRAVKPDDPADSQALAWRKSFAALCHGHGISPAHACIQYALAAPCVAAISVDTSHPDRIIENARHAATEVPASFWASMKEEGLLAENHPFI